MPSRAELERILGRGMARDPHPFYAPPDAFDAAAETIRFPEDEAHHILRVIRLRAGDASQPGDECRVVDGRGGIYRVLLERAGDALIGRVLEARKVERVGRTIEIAFPALRMQARNDWLVEKAVEAGADRLIPIPWERSLKEPSSAALLRWSRIAREAMKQSERVWLPEIHVDPSPFARAEGARWVLADPEGDEMLPDLSGAGAVRLMIGPEGGLTGSERERVLAQGAFLWGLGPARLRAETAAIVGCHALARALRLGRETVGPGGPDPSQGSHEERA